MKILAEKIWVRRVSNEQTCNLHFGRIVTSGVHSRLAAAGCVQGVGGSVTFYTSPISRQEWRVAPLTEESRGRAEDRARWRRA